MVLEVFGTVSEPFGGWLYQLNTIAVSVIYAQADRFEHRRELWHLHSWTSRKRFQIADFMYAKRAEAELVGSADAPIVTA